MLGWRQDRRVRSFGSWGPCSVSASRIDGLHKARFADRNMDATGDGVKTGHIRASSDGPVIRDLTGGAIDFDECAVIACGIEAVAGIVDVETMSAAGGKLPFRDRAQIGQAGDQHHGWLANTDEHTSGGGIGHAPPW